MSEKKLGGHSTCLGDIVQNIAKMNIYCSFSEGAWGVFTKVDLNRTNFNLFN